MREDHEEPVFELQKWFDGGDIFYRPEDKQRLQYAVDAVVDDQSGLAVIGDNERVLDHYCKMLLGKLRDLNGFEIEVFLPMNTVSLLKRFNELLASMSVDEARQPPPADKPVTLLVVNDANEIQEDQWSLLTRLLADFPGVNVRLVLFINKTTWPEYEAPLDQLGRNIYRWALQTATLAEAIELMRAARQFGFQRQTETLLSESGLGAAIEGSYADPNLEEGADLADADDSANPFPDEAIEFLEDTIDDFAEPMEPGVTDRQTPEKRTFWSMALVFVLALAVAWAILSKLSPEPETTVITQVVESKTPPKKILIKPAQTMDAQQKPTASQTSQAQQVVAQIQQDRLQAQDPAPQKQAPVSKPRLIPQQAAVDPGLASAEKSVVEAPKAQEAEPKSDETPDPAPSIESTGFSASLARVKNARASDFFVQHIVLSTEAQANEYMGRYSSLRKAMVLPIQAGQSRVYAIISGPFSTREKAETFAGGTTMPTDYWIRGAVQLQGAI
jgi:hypothetical protein